MSTNGSGLTSTEGMGLLDSILESVRNELPLTELVGQRLAPERVAQELAPLADADAVIEWVAVNGQRVDAVVTADDAQWRVVYTCSSTKVIETLEVFERPSRFDGTSGGRAIVVNGPSGAGKSMLMRALLQIAPIPLVIFDEPEHVGTVQIEYLIWRDRAPALHRGYLEAIAALARAGNHVALPAAGHQQQEFLATLGDVPTLTIGLTCEPDVLRQRERRTGRWGGISDDSPTIHEGWVYDLEFDTTDAPDPIDLARQVLRQIAPD